MWATRLEPLKLRDWATSSEGEAAATQLISVLVTEHLAAPGCPEQLLAHPGWQLYAEMEFGDLLL